LRRRLDPRDLRDHHRPVPALHVQRVRDPGPALHVLPAGRDHRPVPLPEIRCGGRARVRRHEDADRHRRRDRAGRCVAGRGRVQPGRLGGGIPDLSPDHARPRERHRAGPLRSRIAGVTRGAAGREAWRRRGPRGRLWPIPGRCAIVEANPFGRQPVSWRGSTMRRLYVAASAAAVIALLAPANAAWAQDESRTVAGGGIFVEGWQGRIDAREAQRGGTLEGARLAKDGDALHVRTGPAVAYWHPDNRASGSYTVKATFREPEYMALNNHPHPYGVFIAGSDMGTDQ